MEDCKNPKLFEKCSAVFEAHRFFGESMQHLCSTEQMMSAVREMSSCPGPDLRNDMSAKHFVSVVTNEATAFRGRCRRRELSPERCGELRLCLMLNAHRSGVTSGEGEVGVPVNWQNESSKLLGILHSSNFCATLCHRWHGETSVISNT